MKLLENTIPELSDEPSTRTQPVAKCGLGATKHGFDTFGVSVGYCISGSSDTTDYTIYHYPGYCSEGNGGIYYAGIYAYFFMDVYKVLNVSYFTASAEETLRSELSRSPFASDAPSLSQSTSSVQPASSAPFASPTILPSATPTITPSSSPIPYATSSSYAIPSPSPLVDETLMDLDFVDLNSSPEPSGAGAHCCSLLLLSVTGLYVSCIAAMNLIIAW